MIQLIVAIAIAATGPWRDPLGPYRDKPVLAVDLEVPEGEQVEELSRLVNIAPGYLLSTAAVDSALKRLYALGRFSAVELYAERVSGAIVLHFSLKRARHLASLEVSGLSRVNHESFVAALRLPLGTEVDRRTPEVARERALAYLSRVGLPRAEIDVREEKAGPDGVALTLRVTEREPRASAHSSGLSFMNFCISTSRPAFTSACRSYVETGVTTRTPDLPRD